MSNLEDRMQEPMSKVTDVFIEIDGDFFRTLVASIPPKVLYDGPSLTDARLARAEYRATSA